MATGPNRIFDDFAKLMTDAAGAAQGMRREAETMVQAQAEKFLASMDVVQREEFDVMKDVALAAQARCADLEARIAALEAMMKANSGSEGA